MVISILAERVLFVVDVFEHKPKNDDKDTSCNGWPSEDPSQEGTCDDRQTSKTNRVSHGSIE
jgi:hypothetical protein